MILEVFNKLKKKNFSFLTSMPEEQVAPQFVFYTAISDFSKGILSSSVR